MDCEKCQGLLDDSLDGTMPAGERAAFSRHLEECSACAGAREDLEMILGAARESREHTVAPPDERAMWLRIRNSIEFDPGAVARTPAVAAAGGGIWSRLAGRHWSVSFPQFASVAAGVAVSVALVTAFGMRALLTERPAEQPKQKIARRQLQSPDDMVKIEYLRQRVEQRRARWNPHMRETFDRNMVVIDQTVNEMLQELDERPHDDVSEETLNAAMRDKLQLLKEFSEL